MSQCASEGDGIQGPGAKCFEPVLRLPCYASSSVRTHGHLCVTQCCHVGSNGILVWCSLRSLCYYQLFTVCGPFLQVSLFLPLCFRLLICICFFLVSPSILLLSQPFLFHMLGMCDFRIPGIMAHLSRK